MESRNGPSINGPLARRALALSVGVVIAAVAVAALAGPGGVGQAAQGDEMRLAENLDGVQKCLPPIDRERPAKTETAVFALG